VETETVSVGTALVMAGFLLIAALVVLSVTCKLMLATGLVRGDRAGRLSGTVVRLANIVGHVRVVPGRRDRRGGKTSTRGGGGSSGGAGASGQF
jgi:uncharacterized membrane protein YgcG